MRALAAIFVIYLILFLVYGRKNFKNFLLLTGIISLPFPTTLSLVLDTGIGWVNGIILTISNASFIVLFLQILTKDNLFSLGRPPARLSSKVTSASLLFILACCLSAVNSTTRMRTFFQVFMIVKIFVLYYYTFVRSISSEKDLVSVVNFITFALFIQAVYAWAETLLGFTTNILMTGSYGLRTMEISSGVIRAGGFTGKPNTLAMYIVPVLLLNLSIFFGNPRSKVRLLVISVSFIALLFTFSRGGWIGFVLAFIVLIFLCTRKGWIRPRHLFRFTLILGAVGVIFLPWIMQRIYGDDHNAAESRLPLIDIAFNMIREYPILGIGANTFMNVKRDYLPPEANGIYLEQVHNQYLLVWAETGLVGLLAYLGMLKSFCSEARLAMGLGGRPFIQSVGMGVMVGIFAMSIHMMVDMYNSELIISHMFLLAGICTVARQVQPELVETSPKHFKAVKARPY